MRRREFIVGAGAAAAMPLAARTQQGERLRRIGVLHSVAFEDLSAQRNAALIEELARLGWADGRNVRIDLRNSASAAEVVQHAKDLIALAPDVIVVGGSAALGALQGVTRTVPIVFALVPDPVGGGFIDSLARPGGNATGFLSFEYSIGGKWMELLKEASGVTRAAILRDAAIPAGVGQFAVMQSLAPGLGLDVSLVNLRDAAEIERSIGSFARIPNSGLILTASAQSNIHRTLVIALAARHKLPAVYSNRFYTVAGGLMSYGSDQLDQFRRAAGYADRILRGESPADLPVQAPTKYELVINAKTAKALGLTIPPKLLFTADEVIE